MSTPIHEGEPDTSEAVARALLREASPSWGNLPLDYLETSGTDNAMWRVRREPEPDVVLRLARRPASAAGVAQEVEVLRRVAKSGLSAHVESPSILHVGEPHEVFPHPWSVLQWIEGRDAWSGRSELTDSAGELLAVDLGHVVRAIRTVDGSGIETREPGSRGGPVGPLVARLLGWLDDPVWNAASLVDTASIRRLGLEGLEATDEPIDQGFVHGDLIPGNLLMRGGRLSAVIDWGGAGIGDLAQDLAPAWSVLSSAQRSTFRETVGADDAAWIRGRTFELEHAVGGVLYYSPRNHPLGDVMQQTLQRILADRSL